MYGEEKKILRILNDFGHLILSQIRNRDISLEDCEYRILVQIYMKPSRTQAHFCAFLVGTGWYIHRFFKLSLKGKQNIQFRILLDILMYF